MKMSKGISSVAAGAFIMIMLGAAYVWGIYKQPLADYFGWSKAAAAAPFSVFLVFYTLGMILGGKLQDVYGPKNICTAGALMFGAGYFASGFAGNIRHLVLTYGAVAGFGTGLAYVTPVATAAKWFPSKKGLVSGIIIFGFGAGAFLLSPAARWLITLYDWRTAFKILGAFFLAAAVAAARFIEPPESNAAAQIGNAAKKISLFENSPSELLKNPIFYAVWSAWFLCLSAGLGALGHIAAHAENSGAGKMAAAMLLSVIALFNGAGRVALGAWSDKLGRMRIFVAAAATMAVVSAAFAAINPAAGVWRLYLAGALFGLSFGGLLVLYPAIAADFFGTRHLGANYGILFSSYGAAGIAGPIIYGRIFDATGAYFTAFSAGAAAAACAALIVFLAGLKIGFSTDSRT